jgi:hypothetical protein
MKKKYFLKFIASFSECTNKQHTKKLKLLHIQHEMSCKRVEEIKSSFNNAVGSKKEEVGDRMNLKEHEIYGEESAMKNN